MAPFEVNKTFSKKRSYSAEKKLKRGTHWNFAIFLSQNIKKIEGDALMKKLSERKVPQCRKKTGRGSFSLARFCMLREKKRKTFFVKFARPNEKLAP